jgi:hypothetical protein
MDNYETKAQGLLKELKQKAGQVKSGVGLESRVFCIFSAMKTIKIPSEP